MISIVANLQKYLLTAALIAGLIMGSAPSSFGQNLIVNGTFTNFTTTGADYKSTGAGVNIPGGYNTGTTLTGWSNTGYTFLFNTTGSSNNVGDQSVTGSGGALALWGPKNGSNNGLVAAPGGGNTLGLDGVYQRGVLSQVVTGLTSGKQYMVSFEWAGAQQQNYTGATTESYSVALGGTGYNSTTQVLDKAQTTATANNVSKGFTGWMAQSFTFTADATSDTLYFLANGTPNGLPPFSLLADVTMVAVPEPKATACLVILFVMLIMVGNWIRRRFSKNEPASA